MKYVQGAGKKVHDHCNHWIDTTQSIQWTSVTPPNLGGGKTEALGVKTTAGTRGTAKTRWAARGAPAVTPSTDEIPPPIRRTPPPPPTFQSGNSSGRRDWRITALSGERPKALSWPPKTVMTKHQQTRRIIHGHLEWISPPKTQWHKLPKTKKWSWFWQKWKHHCKNECLLYNMCHHETAMH